MKPGAMRDWLGPTLGAALALVAAGGLAYKVIGGYRHASPEHFVSVQDQNRLQAASAADQPLEAATVSVAASATPAAPIIAAPPAPITTAPPLAPAGALESASSVAADLPAEAPDNSACSAIKTEQREIEKGLSKQYSPEVSRYMQRRLRELAQQSVKRKCGE
jgi:hypothetical protein